MLNPFLTTHTWAMQESHLRAIAEQANAFDFDDDGDNDTVPEDDAPYQLIDGVAVMTLTGTLMKYDDIYTMMFGGSSTLAAKQNLQAAVDDPNVTATLIIVDSPGGMVSGTGDLAETIANSSKPVWVYISDCCASAAYWVASQADKVFCNSTASVGSIGVYCVLQDTSKMYEDAGIKVTLVKAGAFKGTGVDGVPITDDQIAEEQRETNEVYSMFIDAVAQGRHMTNSQAAQLATGQMWIASKAKDLGLVDGIASLDAVFGMLSGETSMATKKNSAFSVSKAANAIAKVAEEVAPAETVESVEAPKVEQVEEAKVEAPAVEVEAEAVAENAPETITIEKAKFEAAVAEAVAADQRVKDAKAQSFDEGVQFEKARLASLIEIAPEHPEFVLAQFKAGAERGSAAVAFAQLLSKELKEARAAITVTGGAKAVAIGSLEGRATKDKQPMSFITIKK